MEDNSQKALERTVERKAEKDKLEQKKAKEKMENQKQDTNESDEDNSQGTNKNQEEDEVEYNVFFNTSEIKDTIKDQEQNVFGDITEIKREVQENDDKMNKFEILEWAPVEQDIYESERESKLKRKLTKRRRVTSQSISHDSSEDEQCKQDRIR